MSKSELFRISSISIICTLSVIIAGHLDHFKLSMIMFIQSLVACVLAIIPDYIDDCKNINNLSNVGIALSVTCFVIAVFF